MVVAPKIARWQLDDDITRGWQRFNRSVKPVDTFRGGTHAAMQRLRYFVEHQLAEYEAARRKPQVNGTSQLSPYLHFGHISPLRIALELKRAVDAGKAPQSAYDAYINELIGWRELAVNFVIHSRDTYDRIECAEPWAEKTLREHARDRREYEYTCEQLERGETHDALWNAAQLQMVRYGWMHNILRMYWGKKILEWAPNPAQAFEWAVLLNDTYELDGRDPNSYAGIAWAIAGKFDRPWFERRDLRHDSVHVRRINREEVRLEAVHGAGSQSGDGEGAAIRCGHEGWIKVASAKLRRRRKSDVIST